MCVEEWTASDCLRRHTQECLSLKKLLLFGFCCSLLSHFPSHWERAENYHKFFLPKIVILSWYPWLHNNPIKSNLHYMVWFCLEMRVSFCCCMLCYQLTEEGIDQIDLEYWRMSVLEWAAWVITLLNNKIMEYYKLKP